MEPAIISIGTASPRYYNTQAAIAELMVGFLQLPPTQEKRIKAIYQTAGIDTRHSVLPDILATKGNFSFFPNDFAAPFPTTKTRMQYYRQAALPLALQAIQNCVSQLPDFTLNRITHLITVSCTGMYAPGLDIELVHALNLTANIKRTAINFMGCYGAFNALRLADAICQAQINAVVLIVSVELCTLHFQKSHSMNDLLAATLFADGAGAAIITTPKSTSKYLQFSSFYCDLLPQGCNDMTWEIGDSGFDMLLTSYVPKLIKEGIAEFFTRLLATLALDPTDISLYAIHPGGKKILMACEEALQLQPEQNYHSYEVLRRYGNMSSTTILFVLKAIWDSLEKQDNNKWLFSCAFGPGLTLESMLVQVKVSENNACL